MAAERPQAAALKIPRGRTRAGEIDYLALSFSELDREVAAWQTRFLAQGIRPGDRALVMVPPGLPLIAAVFGLFRLGAVPVVIDPGMGLRNFLPCVARTQPRALVGIPLAQLVSRLFRPSFRSVSVRVRVQASPTARLAVGGSPVGDRAYSSRSDWPAPPPAHPTSPSDLAAILFTSGSTGVPKGVCYEHRMFDAQVRLIAATYGIVPGEVDLPLLPVFALFNPALGMTTIIPEIDPRRPATVDPAKIVQAIRQEGVTNSFGSPTLWRIIADHCRQQGIVLPTLRRVLCAGAPVPQSLWTDAEPMLPQGRLHSPYGATEALPVSSISSAERDFSRPGACVGRPLPGNDVRIIALVDGPIPNLAAARLLPAGEIGEIIVRGAIVTQSYDALPEATALAKIGPPGEAWHRLGDCGFLDEDGKLWMCGRKAEIVSTAAGPQFTEPCEQVFRRHPRVVRCALVGLGEPGRQIPALVVEAAPNPGAEATAFARELRALGRTEPVTSAITRFYFHPKFPVDVRHNAKIHRLTLAKWAAKAPSHDVA